MFQLQCGSFRRFSEGHDLLGLCRGFLSSKQRLEQLRYLCRRLVSSGRRIDKLCLMHHGILLGSERIDKLCLMRHGYVRSGIWCIVVHEL